MRSANQPKPGMKMKKQNLLKMEIHFTRQQIASAGRVLAGTGNKLDLRRANELLGTLVTKAALVHDIGTAEIVQLVTEARARFDRTLARREAKLRKRSKWN